LYYEKNGIKDDALHFNVDMLEREDEYNLMYYLGLSGDIKIPYQLNMNG